MPKKVFVSGCFDLLHSGHVAFFQEAAQYGDVHVALGSDQTVFELKGRTPVNTEQERLYMVQSVQHVKEAFVSQGSGILDFVEEFKALQPDMFVVNADGHIPAKKQLCAEHGVEYVVLKRTPHAALPPRSTTDLRAVPQMPYRIDVAGGWLDQPWVSEHYHGSVITLSIEPTYEFNERSGMASSTRNTALDIWGPRLPLGSPEKLANILFCCDNPPGTPFVSGSQDAIGLVYSGLASAYYKGDYWPDKIVHVLDEPLLQFMEQSIYMITLGPRGQEFDVLADTNINRDNAKALSDATAACWQSIQHTDIQQMGQAVRDSFEAQVAMFPNMMTPQIAELIDQYRDQAYGWKLSGAGGGGYLILISDQEIENATRIIARRASE